MVTGVGDSANFKVPLNLLFSRLHNYFSRLSGFFTLALHNISFAAAGLVLLLPIVLLSLLLFLSPAASLP